MKFLRLTKSIVFILFALMMLNGGLNKIFNYLPVPEDLPEELISDSIAMMEIVWLMPLVAGAEIIGGILLLIPRTRALGILIIFPVMVGILCTHIFVAPSGLPTALILWIILLVLIADHWKTFKPLLSAKQV